MVGKSRTELTPEDIARERGVNSETVRRWIKAGKLRAFRHPSGRYRIPEEEAEKLIAWVEITEHA